MIGINSRSESQYAIISRSKFSIFSAVVRHDAPSFLSESFFSHFLFSILAQISIFVMIFCLLLLTKGGGAFSKCV